MRTYPLAIRIVESLQLNNVGVAYNAHNLQFTILSLSLIFVHVQKRKKKSDTNLESLILQYPLDSSILTARRHLCLEHNAEGAISNNFALGVLHFFGLASQAILNLFTYDFYNSKNGQSSRIWG